MDLARLLVDCDMTDGAAERVTALLHDRGLGPHWNRILDADRARYLASILARFLPKPGARVLDVLSGTGTVAAALRLRGFEVYEAERVDQFDRRPGPWLLDIGSLQSEASRLRPAVVLVLASLHHEPDLDGMLGRLSQLEVPRLLVVENLRSQDTDADLHARFDWYFNRCLNSFGAECPGWYWTREQWALCLSSLGAVRWLMRMDDVPGIPFAYDLFEVMPQPLRAA
jgi:hypothetical protein